MQESLAVASNWNISLTSLAQELHSSFGLVKSLRQYEILWFYIKVLAYDLIAHVVFVQGFHSAKDIVDLYNCISSWNKVYYMPWVLVWSPYITVDCM